MSSKSTQIANLREDRAILQAAKLYYENVLTGYEAKMGDIAQEQEKLDKKRGKIQADYDIAPTRIAELTAQLERLNKVKVELPKPKDPAVKATRKMEKIGGQLEELMGQCSPEEFAALLASLGGGK